jgi:uncharacterized coiled-coil protein SlyX|tara:strand:- start:130 stop:882 length:753 start_codon:yes stop_codon:yes gene_type:complete
MDKKIDNKILEELKRFQTITSNSQNLNEQTVGGMATFEMGSHVDRLLKKARALEMAEQEELEVGDETETEELDIPLDPEGETEELDTDIDAEADATPPPLEGAEETEIDDTTGDETELDVTELVTTHDEMNSELSDQKDILQKNTESLDDLMNKLSSLESHLTSMDDMVNKISNLEKKIEEYRPRTPEEKIGLRKHDSGPYTKTLTDFFTDKEDVFDETGKKQYILKPDDLEDYSNDDIKKSFDPDQEEN